MAEIVPAIIAKTYEELEDRVRRVEPYVDRVHLDIMDGIFVPNKTITGYTELLKLDTKLKFDVHLMVSKPEDQMFYWYKTGADRFIIHIETDHGHKSLMEQVRLNGRKVGLAINPETRIESLDELTGYVDLIQFMTVKPGFYGSPFDESVLDKISEFHSRHPDIPIIVDGGIHLQTARRAIIAGASTLVLGSHIFEEERDVGKVIEELKSMVHN